MTDTVFVDTNILVYARDSFDPAKQRIAYDALKELWRKGTGRLSVQVCNEYFVMVTRKLKPGMEEASAWEDVEMYAAWDPLPLTYKTLQKAREAQLRYGLSWWDSLIVSSAYGAECSKILSEDLSPDQEYFGIKAVNPFTG